MRVGLLSSNPSPQKGGSHTYQQDLLRCFLELAAESRHEFHLLCEPGDAGDLDKAVAHLANVRTARLSALRAPRPLRVLLRAARRAVGYQGGYSSRERRVALALKLELLWSLGEYPHEAFDIPYISTVFDLQHRVQPWFPEVSEGRQWQIRDQYCRDYLPRAAFVITGTEQGRSEIERYYEVPPARTRILPFAAPRFAAVPGPAEVAARLGAMDLQPGYLFYPAQFWSHKNHVNLLLALRLLHAEHGLPYKLVLVGSDHGNQAHVRRTVADLGLEPHVRFLGFVPQEDLVALYCGAHALAYVTFFGPDNLPPLEAFALGCPVVASAVDGSSEQLGDAALLVRPESPQEIAAAVRRLHDDGALRAALIERGRLRARQWTGPDYIRGVFGIIDEFEAIRRCWQ